MKRSLLILVLAVTVALGPGTRAIVAGRSSSGEIAARLVREWRASVDSSARAGSTREFANLSRRALLTRLRAEAVRTHFQVVSVQFLRPRQDAPLVVVTAADERAFAAATPAILREIDPKARTGDDRTGWAYEGLLLEARDSHGTPFLVVFNHWRGPHAGGGQWAADPSLLPFAHG